MRKPLLVLSGFGATILLAAYLAFCLATPRDGVTQQGFEKIQVGMTHHEVQAIVGGPPRVVASGPTRDGAALVADLYVNNCDTVWGKVVPERWHGEQGILVVLFDQRGRAVDKLFVPWERNQSVLGKLRRWLGLAG